MSCSSSSRPFWPALPYEAWQDTCATLHLWTQIVGKLRLALMPWTNHQWHVPLYVTARGLGTSPLPCNGRFLDVEFDFIRHQLVIRDDGGNERHLILASRTVADFHESVLKALSDMGFEIRIGTRPNEIPNAIEFPQDRTHCIYDPERTRSFWHVLQQVDRVFKLFRSAFLGKASPVHFFWGSFDLAVTRFSGRRAPLHPGGVPNLPDRVAQEAYSHELSSAGFWPGNGGLGYPAFYSYAWPEPEGFPEASVQPQDAFYDRALSEFVLPYDVVRASSDPDGTLLAFLQTTYEAAANAGGWRRDDLECAPGRPGIPRAI